MHLLPMLLKLLVALFAIIDLELYRLLAMVLLFKPSNIALGKTTMQSDVYVEKDVYLNASLAVDGVMNAFVFGIVYCAHTLGHPQTIPWWTVDLGAIYTVLNVVIFGRTDCCTERLSDFDIDVIMPPYCSCDKWATFQRGKISQCHHQLPATTFLNATCPSGTVGQFVRVQRRAVGVLTLCEVEVYGILNPTQLQPMKKNVRYACGFSGGGYSGNIIETTRASSYINCLIKCTSRPKCCAAEFTKSNKQCILLAKANGNEETTHSLY